MNFKSLFFFLMLVVAAQGVCELPKAVGHCRADLPRYFFSNGACELFHYSGCGGNDNNFNTKASCEETCLIKKVGAGKRDNGDDIADNNECD